MLYYLNNWRNREHANIYGGNAMFDLWADGVEDKRVRAMQPGDVLLVLSHSGRINATVGRYLFTDAVHRPNDTITNRGVWVINGTLSGRETLTKAAAAEHPEYARFFNKRGHVCQWSVLRDA